MNAFKKHDLTGLHILFVDDEEDILFTMGGLLEALHATVTTCVSGLAAFELISTTPFNLIILDIQMPQVSGWDLIKAIRAHPNPRVKGLTVIALTARVYPQDKESVLKAGYDAYFRKPPDRDTFLTFLSSHARRPDNPTSQD